MSNVTSLDTARFANLTPSQATAFVKEVAEIGGGSKVRLSKHAREQMKERNITFSQILNCLRKGAVYENPYKDHSGKWTCRVTRMCAGEDLNVAVRLEPPAKLLVITTF